MYEAATENIRAFRLRAHHLDAAYSLDDATRLAGACGMQDSPPGAWEAALHVRIPEFRHADADRLLNREKSLVQAWSLRGAPFVFPASESATFLSALIPQPGEPWIYTNGIGLALDALDMDFDTLLDCAREAAHRLDGVTISSKVLLDQAMADWMEPHLPAEKRKTWRAPSMYGSPDKQTVGGAAASFLLRPCAFEGRVVFAERKGRTPSFTSYQRWTGRALQQDDDAAAKLMRTFLRCYAPATPAMLASWTGCSGKQARRMWNLVADELAVVQALGKKAFVLASDLDELCEAALPAHGPKLLPAHDPYLDQRDRTALQANAVLRRRIWRTVSNPGAVIDRGEVVGIWNGRKKGTGLEVTVELWQPNCNQEALREQAEAYAAFQETKLACFDVLL